MKPLDLQFGMDTWTPIDAAMVLKHLFDALAKFGIFSAVLARLSFAPGVKPDFRRPPAQHTSRSQDTPVDDPR